MVAFATLAGCTEEGPPLAPDAEASFAVSSGRGGGSGSAPWVETFFFWDEKAWIASDDKKLGHGFFERDNVTVEGGEDGKLILTLPGTPQGDAPVTDGAEIRSASRVAFRNVEITMQTPDVPKLGTISAVFLYQLIRTRNDRNDEIDIEIINGTQKVIFSTYLQGNPVPTNQVETILPFDPWDGPHTYRIEWSPGRVRFLVDNETLNKMNGDPMEDWTTGVPTNAMYVMVNTWWPAWDLFPSVPTGMDGDHVLEIESITY